MDYQKMKLEDIVKRSKPTRFPATEKKGVCEGMCFIKWAVYSNKSLGIENWAYDLILFYSVDEKNVLLIWQGVPFDGKDQFHIRTLKGKIQLKKLTKLCHCSGRL